MEFLQDVYFSNMNPVCHIGGFFSIDTGDNWSLGQEKFAQNKFYYIKNGRCEIVIEGKKYEGKAGRWFFIPAGVSHYYQNDKTAPFSKYWMHFDLYPNTVDFFKILNLPYYIDIENAETQKNVDRFFDEFTKAVHGDQICDKLREKVCLIELFGSYITLANQSKKQPSVKRQSDTLVDNVTKYIENNIDKNLSIKNLSEFCHLHPNYFIRTFKEKTGLTPAKYMRTLKLENAKRLLEESDLSIIEVMNRVGFDDAAHFSKLFKSYFGMSPKKWRQNVNMMLKYFYIED
ncbi:MAG: AraC family transcriptional regulator [Ruminococcaceae bacterium]|nr:AraC family transcriptional regulator [Oscillospiraceae bacterium]